MSLVRFRVRAPSLKNPPLAGFCVYGANPLSKVRFTRHIPVARLWVALARDAKMRPAFSGSGTIFKEPAYGGFLHSGANPLSKVRYTRHILGRALRVAQAREAKMLPAFLSGFGHHNLKKPASGGFFAFWSARFYTSAILFYATHLR